MSHAPDGLSLGFWKSLQERRRESKSSGRHTKTANKMLKEMGVIADEPSGSNDSFDGLHDLPNFASDHGTNEGAHVASPRVTPASPSAASIAPWSGWSFSGWRRRQGRRSSLNDMTVGLVRRNDAHLTVCALVQSYPPVWLTAVSLPRQVELQPVRSASDVGSRALYKM